MTKVVASTDFEKAFRELTETMEAAAAGRATPFTDVPGTDTSPGVGPRDIPAIESKVDAFVAAVEGGQISADALRLVQSAIDMLSTPARAQSGLERPMDSLRGVLRLSQRQEVRAASDGFEAIRRETLSHVERWRDHYDDSFMMPVGALAWGGRQRSEPDREARLGIWRPPPEEITDPRDALNAIDRQRARPGLDPDQKAALLAQRGFLREVARLKDPDAPSGLQDLKDAATGVRGGLDGPSAASGEIRRIIAEALALDRQLTSDEVAFAVSERLLGSGVGVRVPPDLLFPAGSTQVAGWVERLDALAKRLDPIDLEAVRRVVLGDPADGVQAPSERPTLASELEALRHELEAAGRTDPAAVQLLGILVASKERAGGFAELAERMSWTPEQLVDLGRRFADAVPELAYLTSSVPRGLVQRLLQDNHTSEALAIAREHLAAFGKSIDFAAAEGKQAVLLPPQHLAAAQQAIAAAVEAGDPTKACALIEVFAKQIDAGLRTLADPAAQAAARAVYARMLGTDPASMLPRLSPLPLDQRAPRPAEVDAALAELSRRLGNPKHEPFGDTPLLQLLQQSLRLDDVRLGFEPLDQPAPARNGPLEPLPGVRGATSGTPVHRPANRKRR